MLDLHHEAVTFVSHLCSHVVLLLVVEFATLDNALNLLLDLTVLFFKLVRIRAQIVDIIVETVVLLLCLNECIHSLLDRRDASGLADLLKGVLHGSHVLNVLVHKLFLTLVGLDDL